MVAEIEPNQKISPAADLQMGNFIPLLVPWNLTMNAPTKNVHIQFKCALSRRHLRFSIAPLVVDIKPKQKKLASCRSLDGELHPLLLPS